MQVKVHAEVVNPKDETRETTNDFYFTFNTRNKDVPSVIPKTYAGKGPFLCLFCCSTFQSTFWGKLRGGGRYILVKNTT